MNKTWFAKKTNLVKIGILIIVLVGGWYGYKYFTTSQTKAPTYQTAQLEKGTIVVSVTGSGQVSTANSGSISTEATGVVKRVIAKNGQTVKSGDQIAEIDLDQTAEQKYQQALASYQSAKNNLASAQASLYSLQSKMFVTNQTFVKGAGSTNDPVTEDPTYIEQNADWLASEANYKNQQNVIAQAQTSVNSSWMSVQQTSPFIYAPISGTVTGLSLQPGSVLTSSSTSSDTTSSQKVASIITPAAPTITISLTEVDVPKVKIGDKATLTFDAISDKTYTGKVVSIDTVGAVSSNVTSYPTVIQLDASVPEIYSNMSAQASIIVDSKSDVIVVPTSAIQTQNGQATVKVMKNNQPEAVAIETGISSDTQTEIVSGLSEGDTIVTSTITAAKTTTSSQSTSAFSSLGRGGFGGGAAGATTIRTTR